MTIAQGDCGGLVFRAVDAQNYYILYVCQNGQYQSARYVKRQCGWASGLGIAGKESVNRPA